MNNYFWSSSTKEGWDTALDSESVHQSAFHFTGQGEVRWETSICVGRQVFLVNYIMFELWFHSFSEV